MNKITICKGICGIGNRILFLTQAIRRCHTNGSKLFVLWNDYMYSDEPKQNVFYDAFQIHSAIDAGYRQLNDIPGWKTMRTEPSLWKGMLDRDIYRLSPGFRDLRRASATGHSAKASSNSQVEVCFGAPPPYHRSRNLLGIRSSLTANVSPSIEIVRHVDTFFNQHLAGQPSLGIHIRACSSNKRKIQLSNLWRKVELYLSKTTNARVFLATDGWHIQDLFKTQLGDRLIVRNKWMSSSSSDETGSEENSLHKRRPHRLQPGEPFASQIFWDAVVEMFVLSRCDMLFYQHNSSFSVVASLYSKPGTSLGWGRSETSVAQFACSRSLKVAASSRIKNISVQVMPRIADGLVLEKGKRGRAVIRFLHLDELFELDDEQSRIVLLCSGSRTVKEISGALPKLTSGSATYRLRSASKVIQKLAHRGLLDIEPIRCLDDLFLIPSVPLKSTGIGRAPAGRILEELLKCRKLFAPRSLLYSQHWSSVDIIRDSKWTHEANHCQTFVRWLQQHVHWMPNRAYVAKLEARGEIGWHSDYSEKEGFSKGFIMGLQCPKGSFIEFLNAGKYTYGNGASYHAKLGVAHRVVNPTNSPRFTAFIGSPGHQ
ncbi:MAG: hypothetical protein ACR2HX_09920 [Pyrinomonadaceae bacterium]